MASPYVPERLLYTQVGDEHTKAALILGFVLVGTDRLPLPDGYPTGRLVEYLLNRDASDLRPHDQYEGMEEGTAVYEIATISSAAQ